MYSPSLLIAALVLFASESRAAIIFSSDAEKIGHFAGGGSNSFGQTNAIAGSANNTNDANQSFNAYLRFDLSGFAGGAVAATLHTEVTALFSPQGQEPVTLFSVESPPSDFDISTSGTSSALGQALFADLQAGLSYGNAVIDQTGVFSIDLSLAGIERANLAAGGDFVIGLHLTAVSRQLDDPFSEFVRFGNFGNLNAVNRLELSDGSATVPEPASAALVVLGLAALLCFQVRSKPSCASRQACRPGRPGQMLRPVQPSRTAPRRQA